MRDDPYLPRDLQQGLQTQRPWATSKEALRHGDRLVLPRGGVGLRRWLWDPQDLPAQSSLSALPETCHVKVSVFVLKGSCCF